MTPPRRGNGRQPQNCRAAYMPPLQSTRYVVVTARRQGGVETPPYITNRKRAFFGDSFPQRGSHTGGLPVRLALPFGRGRGMPRPYRAVNFYCPAGRGWHRARHLKNYTKRITAPKIIQKVPNLNKAPENRELLYNLLKFWGRFTNSSFLRGAG